MNVRRTPRVTRIYVRLEPQDVRRVEGAVAMLIGAALVLTFTAHSVAWIPSPIRWQITLAAENSVATWFASMLLFSVGLAALTCSSVERQIVDGKVRHGLLARPAALVWGCIAAAFFFLSLDEMGSLHERLADQAAVRFLLSDLGLLEGWGSVLAVPLVLAGGLVVWAAWRWFRSVPGVAVLIAAGVLLFLSLPLLEHFELTSGAANRHANPWGRPAWQIVVEEGAELLAALCFLSAGLRFAEHRSRDLRRLDGKVAFEFGGRIPAAAVALAVLTLAVLYAWAPETLRPPDDRGVPANWLPAVAAFLAFLVALHLAAAEKSRIGTPPGSLIALRALAGVSLVLSALYAADFPVYHLLDNRPALQSAWLFALGSGVLLTGMFAARISNSGLVTAGLLMWSSGPAFRPLSDPAAWPAVALLAQLGLLLALYGYLAARARQPWVVSENVDPCLPSPAKARQETA